MELNKLAGRTFNDLMQYPVFPFIVADYQASELDLRRAESFRFTQLITPFCHFIWRACIVHDSCVLSLVQETSGANFCSR